MGTLPLCTEMSTPFNWALTNPLYAYGIPAFLFDTVLSQYSNGIASTTNFSTLSGLTFTRASVGYAQTSAGVLQQFASGVPRITDKGLLIEGARTNLCLRSQEFDNASWTKANVTITANAAVAPDGTLTADKIESTSTTSVALNQSAAVAATAATVSAYAKKGTSATRANTFRLRNSTTATTLVEITINYDTGAITYVTGSTGAVVTLLADGWLRVSLSSASGITSGDTIRFDACFDGTATASGDFAYAWGAQLEAAAFPSSYIPTTSSSATRAADVCSIAVSGISYPATLFAEYERVVDTGGNEAFIQINAGSNNDQANISVNGATDKQRTTVNSGGAGQADISSAASVAVGSVVRGALRVATNDINQALLGVLGTQDVSATVPSNPTTLILGSNASATPCFGFIKRAAVWNSAFTDAQLQAVAA